MDSFGHLGGNGYELLDQLATSVERRVEGGRLGTEDFVRERLMKVISATAQVAILWRLQHYRLVLRGGRRTAWRGWERDRGR